MPGRSGKLTREALKARGPRMILAQGTKDNGERITIIFREDASPFAAQFNHGSFLTDTPTGAYVNFRELARSFTLSYLLKIGRVNANL